MNTPIYDQLKAEAEQDPITVEPRKETERDVGLPWLRFWRG